MERVSEGERGGGRGEEGEEDVPLEPRTRNCTSMRPASMLICASCVRVSNLNAARCAAPRRSGASAAQLGLQDSESWDAPSP